MSHPEILAPAGSFESLAAAVFCGADAVYLGSRVLNARRNADNFDETTGELARAVAFCHLRGVKVYQALNILMYEQELDELLSAVRTAAALGIDGVMVQDFAAVQLIRRCTPGLPVFASTQMAVHNLAGALEAERIGCRRVVLARELSAREIRTIVENTSLEVEVFVHGALCMSVSGQCYFSSMLGGRSGNRGLCAQPCRLPFSAGNRSHALSLRDLSLVSRIEELKSLGVASLKIEGRMKRPEYVAAAVTALRQARSGQTPDLDQLRSVFSRSGFTSGYFDGILDGSMYGIREKEDVVAASGVFGELSRLASQEQPRVALTGSFFAAAEQPVTLTLSDGDSNTVVQAGEPPQSAHSKPTDEERVRQSLSKTGGTPFFFASLDVSLGEGLMLPVSQLNALRRGALGQLEEIRSAPKPIPYDDAGVVRAHPKLLNLKIPTLRARCTASQLSPALLDCCGELILPLGDVDAALARGVEPCRIIAEIPRVLFEWEERAACTLKALAARGVSRAWAGNLGAIRLARQAGMDICGGWSLNLFSSHGLLAGRDLLGLSDAELSFELSLERARQLGDYLPYGIVGWGNLPLMVFRSCPMKAAVGCERCRQQGLLTDRKGITFTVRCRDGVSELFNSVPLYLADRREELTGFSFVTLWFTGEPAELCADIAAQYAGRAPARPPKGGHTRGLYYRTVL